jgi:tol-pal system protein YbgF
MTSASFPVPVRFASLAVLGVVALAGCASQSQVRRLQSEVGNLRATVGELGRETEEAVAARARLAETVKHLETRLDVLQAETRRAGDEMGQLGRKLEAAEVSVRQTRALLDAPAPPPPTATAAPAEPPRPAEAPRLDAAEQVYAAALASFRSGEHGQAVLDFGDFLAKFPGHVLAPDAQYWIGEAYFSERDCRHAVNEYRRVLDHGVTSARAPDALLKIGLCHAALHDEARARQAWRRVLRDYPTADAAARARSLLQRQGAAGRP